MKKLIYITALILAQPLLAYLHAQNAIFLTQGRIEFEKKENKWAQIDSLPFDDDDWKTLMKKNVPQFVTTYFDLRFNGTKSLYQPGREGNTANNNMFMDNYPASDNVVFTSLATQQSTSQKNVFEEKFLVQDSLRKVKWKITNEVRTIAGFECRRANALIMDSIYVVAFYTDEIITRGGPESFTGLPGMIMGLVIPHEHVSWFATKVYTENITDKDLAIPARGTKVTNAALLALLRDRMKGWGRFAAKNILAVML